MNRMSQHFLRLLLVKQDQQEDLNIVQEGYLNFFYIYKISKYRSISRLLFVIFMKRLKYELVEQEEEEEERRVTFNHVHEEREEYDAEEPLDESVHQQLADEHQLTPEQRVQEDPNVS